MTSTASLARRAHLSVAEIVAETGRLSRIPFVKALNDLLVAQPSMANLISFADTYPDRWAQAVSIMAKLAGYHDKLELTGNLTVDIGRMSDSQLMAAMQEIDGIAVHVEKGAGLEPLPRNRSLVCVQSVPNTAS